MPLRVDQSSIIERKVGGGFITSHVGHFGPNVKANAAHDRKATNGLDSSMAERLTETEEKLAFIRRVRTAREARYSQDQICTILGIDRGSYKHYETRSVLPHRFIPKFVAATGVSYEWLLSGDGKGPPGEEFPKETPKRIRRAPTRRAA